MPNSPEIAACVKCQKLFVGLPADRKCPACTAEHEQKVFLVENAIYYALKQTVEDIIEYTRLPEDEVVKILKSLRYLNESVSGETRCTRCKKNPVQTGSEFCQECRAELHQAIGKAAGAINDKIGKNAYRPTEIPSLNSVVAEFNKKRQRTSAESLRPRQTKFK